MTEGGEKKNPNTLIAYIAVRWEYFFLLLFLIFGFVHNGVTLYLELTQFSIKN